ncbi:MAG: hypothetical protein JWN86_735, partial [Planctomycetota bacterium]|nr:hypothetical protein [Planctomycetota bacterium]
MPDRYRFPGFTPFLRLAEAGVTDLSILSHARRQPALAALASLCAQAADAPAEHVAEIFAHGLKARDG